MLILLACHFSAPLSDALHRSDPAGSPVEGRMYAEPKETGGGDTDTGGADSPAESGGDTAPADSDSGTDSGADSGTDSGDSSAGRVGKSAAELSGEPGGFGCSAAPAGWSPAWAGLLALGLLLRRRG